MLWKVYFSLFFCDPTSSDSTIWHRIHRMNLQPRHFDKNNKMLHFRARHDGIFEHKLLDVLKNLLLNSLCLDGAEPVKEGRGPEWFVFVLAHSKFQTLVLKVFIMLMQVP